MHKFVSTNFYSYREHKLLQITEIEFSPPTYNQLLIIGRNATKEIHVGTHIPTYTFVVITSHFGKRFCVNDRIGQIPPPSPQGNHASNSFHILHNKIIL